MTSLEVVDIINADRPEQVMAGAAEKFIELAHRSFMAKVPEVLGAGSAKFIELSATHTRAAAATIAHR